MGRRGPTEARSRRHERTSARVRGVAVGTGRLQATAAADLGGVPPETSLSLESWPMADINAVRHETTWKLLTELRTGLKEDALQHLRQIPELTVVAFLEKRPHTPWEGVLREVCYVAIVELAEELESAHGAGPVDAHQLEAVTRRVFEELRALCTAIFSGGGVHRLSADERERIERDIPSFDEDTARLTEPLCTLYLEHH